MKHDLKLLKHIFSSFKLNEFDKINCDGYICHKPTRFELFIDSKLTQCPLSMYAKKHCLVLSNFNCSDYYNSLRL